MLRTLAVTTGLFIIATPASAQDAPVSPAPDARYQCVASRMDASIPDELTDLLLRAVGLGDGGSDVSGQLDPIILQCAQAMTIPTDNLDVYADLVIAGLFRDESRERLAEMGIALDWLDAFVDEKLEQVPASSNAFHEQHQDAIAQLTIEQLGPELAEDALVGALLDFYTTGLVRFRIAQTALPGETA